MNKNTGRDRRYLITKNSILMLVMLVIIIFAIWAWFTSAPNAEAGGLHLAAADPDTVQIAKPTADDQCPEDSAFGSSIYLGEVDTQQLVDMDQLLYRDITSDGLHFIIPAFEASKDDIQNGRRVIEEGSWTEGKSTMDVLSNDSTDDDEEYHYVKKNFYLRAPKGNISVSANSYLAAQSDLENKPLKSNDKTQLVRNNEAYGDGLFSCDAIVGAVRVSLTGQPVTESGLTTQSGEDTLYGSADSDPRFLWLPRPDICLNTENDYDNFYLTTGILPTNSNYVEKTYRHTFYKRQNNNNTDGVTQVKYYDTDIAGKSGVSASYSSGAQSTSFFHVSQNVTAENTTTGHYPTLGKDCSITTEGSQPKMTFSVAGGSTAEYYVYKMTLNLWIEGEDAEARRAMGEGEFKLFLEFK